MSRAQHLRALVLVAAAGVALAVIPHGLSVYLRSFVMFTMMYVVLALSWNTISGFTGYTSFGHVFFYGLGAYACAILVADYGWWASRCCASRGPTSPSPCWAWPRAGG
jgi:ABC-type branched-subunit amino acid transport system permease subunit